MRFYVEPVENRIRNLKDCGLERMPFTSFAANAAWMDLVLTAADLLAWCQPDARRPVHDCGPKGR